MDPQSEESGSTKQNCDTQNLESDTTQYTKQVSGPKLLGITRAKAIEEYKKARQMVCRNQSVVLTNFAYNLLVNPENGNYELVKNFEDMPNWKKAIKKCVKDVKKLLGEYRDSLKRRTKTFPDPHGLCFSFSNWPDLVNEKRAFQEFYRAPDLGSYQDMSSKQMEQHTSQDSDIASDSLTGNNAQVSCLKPPGITRAKVVSNNAQVSCLKPPGITRAKVVEEYKKARQKCARNCSINFNAFAYDLLVNTDYGNYELVKNFEDSPNWIKAIRNCGRNVDKVLKEHRNSLKSRTKIFKDPEMICFSLSQWPDLVCEKQIIQENDNLVEGARFENNISGHSLPYITRAKMVEEYTKARQNISKNQSLVFTDFAYDLLVNTKHDHHQLIKDFENNPNWNKAVSQCAKAVKLVLKDHIISIKKSTVFEDPDSVSFTFEDWPDLLREKKPHPQSESETQRDPVAEVFDQLKSQGVSVSLSDRWSCKICHEDCESKAHLHRHWCLNHKVFKCCGLEFYGKLQIQKHQNRHQQKSKRLVAKDTKSLLPQKKSSRVLQFACPICGKKFVTAKNMLQHKRDGHEMMQQLPQYHCSMCFRKFITEEALREHEPSHSSLIWLDQESPKILSNITTHDQSIDNSSGNTDSKINTLKEGDPLNEKFPIILKQRSVMENSQNVTNTESLKEDPLISRPNSVKEYTIVSVSAFPPTCPKEKSKTAHDIQQKTDPLKVIGPPKPRPNGCDQCEMRFEYKYQLLCHQSLSHKSFRPTGPMTILNKNSPTLVHQVSKGESEDLTTMGKIGDMGEKVNTGGEIVDEVESIEIKYEPII